MAPAAVHSVDEFAFSVPALEDARQFYTAFGLDVRAEEGGLGLYTHGHAHRWARIVEGGARKKLLWIRFGIHGQDLPAFESRLAQQGVARMAAPAGCGEDADAHGGSAGGGGPWLRGPDGLPVQLRVAPKVSPSQPGPREFAPPCRNAGRAPARSRVQPVRPLYLSHILLFTAEVDAARAFYEGLLGLRLSDRSGSAIAFLHSPHGSDHHLLALAKSGGGGLHHSSWCVPSLDAVGHGMEQMAAAGHPRGWGVGRHVLGSNYFRYVRDPWGSWAEYSFDIDHVAAGATWPAADHPGEDALYTWGPGVPPDFITNHEIA